LKLQGNEAGRRTCVQGCHRNLGQGEREMETKSERERHRRT